MLKQGEKFYNKVKWMLKDGQKTVGAWLQLASPISAEIFGKAGFDWVMVDMEHGPGDILTLSSQLQALAKFDVVPFARAPWNDFVTIKRMLDVGLYGILVPYVCNKEEAQAAVRACKYPMTGIRGVAPSPRAGGFGMNGLDYLKNANEQILVMVQIETPQAVENIEEILSVEGLDGVFVGPMDLSCSMGHFGDPSHPDVQAAIRKVEEAAKKSDKFLGTVSGGIQQAQALYDRGYQLITTMSDSVTLGKMALDTVKAFHELYPNR